jgi:PilZ domain
VESTPEHLLGLAQGILPPPPCSIDLISEDGGSFAVSFSGYEDNMILLHAPRLSVRKQLRLLARISDQQRGGYEVELEILDCFFHSGEHTLVHAIVTAVRRRKGRRLAPRVAISQPATARIVASASLPTNTELDVRITDVSATGLAFSSQRPLDTGDQLTVHLDLSDRPTAITSRVARCDRAPYGRFRVGCEIRNLTEHDHQALARLSQISDSPSATSDRRRSPDAPTRHPAQQPSLKDHLDSSRAAA